MTRRITIWLLAAFISLVALPVRGYFQSHGFFSVENKYREVFHETKWLSDARADEARSGGAARERASTAVKYPYPEKPVTLTAEMWRKSVAAVVRGDPDWYDVEIIRQRAELEEYAPAMDTLGWMYEWGRGLEQDDRKAFTWYERAKLAGKQEVQGSTAVIFDRMLPPEKLYAQIQLAEDIQRMKPDAEVTFEGFEQVKLHVFRQQRDLNVYRKTRDGKKGLVKTVPAATRSGAQNGNGYANGNGTAPRR